MQLRWFDKKLILFCSYSERDIPKSLGARWSYKPRGWVLPTSLISYLLIREAAAKANVSLAIQPEIISYFYEKSEGINKFKVSKEFKTVPYEHQKDMTSLIMQMPYCFIFGGVGVGKTKSAIDAVALRHEMGEVKKVLVISPSSIMWNFANEVTTHSHFDSTVIVGPLKKRRELIADSTTVFDIVNYEILVKLYKEIKAKKYDMMIFDEVHYCKGRTTNRAKAAFAIAHDVPYRVGLSGTIISNNYQDIYMPYKVISPEIFGTNYNKFKLRYCVMVNWFGYDQIEGYRNEEELKSLIAKNSIKFSIRDVVKNLPPEKDIVKKIALSVKNKKIYKDIEKNMISEMDNGEITVSNALDKILRLSQLTSGFLVDSESGESLVDSDEKLDVLSEILSQITEKTAIFCRFTRSIDKIAALCEKLKISYYIYDGRTKEKDLYLKFNTDDTQVWLAQIQKSEGYSIPAAQYCIFYELDYSRKNHVQSRGRILRATGSPHDCIFYIYLLVEGTIDEVVYQSLEDKDFTSNQALELVRGALKEEAS